MDLNEIIEEAKWLLPLYGKGGVELILSLTEEKLPVLADRSLIKEMLVDLVANTTEALTGSATLTLKTRRVRFESQESGECVHFSLSSRGSRPLIGGTIRGTQGSPVGAKVRTINVGTGLSRVYTIIRQQHNGNIRIDHGPEDCATVNIFLPLFR